MKVTVWAVVTDGRFLCVAVKDEKGVESRHGSFVTSDAAATWAKENFQVVRPTEWIR